MIVRKRGRVEAGVETQGGEPWGKGADEQDRTLSNALVAARVQYGSRKILIRLDRCVAGAQLTKAYQMGRGYSVACPGCSTRREWALPRIGGRIRSAACTEIAKDGGNDLLPDQLLRVSETGLHSLQGTVVVCERHS